MDITWANAESPIGNVHNSRSLFHEIQKNDADDYSENLNDIM